MFQYLAVLKHGSMEEGGCIRMVGVQSVMLRVYNTNVSLKVLKIHCLFAQFQTNAGVNHFPASASLALPSLRI